MLALPLAGLQGLLSGLWGFLKPFLPFIAAAAVGFFLRGEYEAKVPWGSVHRLVALTADRDRWHLASDANAATATANLASFRTSEGLRVKETGAAKVALDQAAAQCDARVARAKSASLALAQILNRKVPTDAKGCPIRQLVPAGELRRAIAPS